MSTPVSNVTTYINQFFKLHILSRVLLLMRVTMNKFNLVQVRGYSRKYEHACGITKKWQERSVKGHSYKLFPLDFPNLGHLVNAHVVFTESKLYHFSKRDLRADTAHYKWLKEALQIIIY